MVSADNHFGRRGMINRIRPVARDVNVVEDRFTVFLMDSGKLKVPFHDLPDCSPHRESKGKPFV
jgi:hypothetical protein